MSAEMSTVAPEGVGTRAGKLRGEDRAQVGELLERVAGALELVAVLVEGQVGVEQGVRRHQRDRVVGRRALLDAETEQGTPGTGDELDQQQ